MQCQVRRRQGQGIPQQPAGSSARLGPAAHASAAVAFPAAAAAHAPRPSLLRHTCAENTTSDQGSVPKHGQGRRRQHRLFPYQARLRAGVGRVPPLAGGARPAAGDDCDCSLQLPGGQLRTRPQANRPAARHPHGARLRAVSASASTGPSRPTPGSPCADTPLLRHMPHAFVQACAQDAAGGAALARRAAAQAKRSSGRRPAAPLDSGPRQKAVHPSESVARGRLRGRAG